MSKKSGKCGAESDGVRQFLNHAPGVLGGVITSAAGVPGGEAIVPMLSSVVGNVISGIGQDFWSRRLSQHEKRRVGATVLGYAIDEIDRRFQAGERERADGFFDPKLAGRSDADEVAESVILKVQREPEERKIPYMGYLFSSMSPLMRKSAHNWRTNSRKSPSSLHTDSYVYLKLVEVKDQVSAYVKKSYRTS